MTPLLEWLRDYSVPVVGLLAVGSAFLLVARTVVEKAVTSRLDAYAERLRLQLARRSGFEEKILTDRYVTLADLHTRLQRMTTTANRAHHGSALPDGFVVAGDVVPLTEVYEQLDVQEILLGPRLHPALLEAAGVVLRMVDAAHTDDWPSAASAWLEVRVRLRAAADEEFGLAGIRW
ncbi:hypothetical protein ACI780_07275 [Geodermatophilus sp. SYSU D00814]